MTLAELKLILAANPKKTMRFVLPDGRDIPPHYHITEVGCVRKDFIDCGGTERSQAACVLQAWLAVNDEDHRLEAGKLGAILALAGKILPQEDLPVELEYEASLLSQFTVSGWKNGPNEIELQLAAKHTDCLAKESCGLEGASCYVAAEKTCC